MASLYGHDCFAPAEIAEKIESIGVAKANLPLVPMLTLSVLAGAFIGLGAMVSTIVLSDGSLGFALSRILAGVVFSLGLILVVIAGAELFTGNNLLVMSYVAGRIPGGRFARNLAVVFAGNFAGALGLAGLVHFSGHTALNDGAIGEAAARIAAAKVAIPFLEAFLRGVLCNILVCLALWLAMAGRSVTDKVIAIVFPITAFVAAGFEHSIANLYFIPLGMLVQTTGAIEGAGTITMPGFAQNVVAVTLGNLAGGAGFVGLVYHVVYRRSVHTEATQTPTGSAPPVRMQSPPGRKTRREMATGK